MTGSLRPTSGRITCCPMAFVYRGSSGWTATAISASIVSGRVVATTKPPVGSSANGYRICHRWPSASSCTTSTSARAVSHRGHQFTSRSARYSNPSSQRRTNTSRTARWRGPSMVKDSRAQSQEAPIFLSWSMMVLPDCSRHCHTRATKASRPICCRVTPSARS